MKLKLIFIIIFTILKSSLFANVIQIDESTKSLEILSLSKIYMDDTKSLSFDEVKKKKFVDNDKHLLSYGYSPHMVLWIKFTLHNNSTKAIEKIIQYEHTVTNDLKFYDGNKIYQDGILKFKEKRTILTPNFTINLNANEVKTYYIRVESAINPLIIKLKLWDVKEFYFSQVNRQFFLALFFGGMAVLFIYNFFIFLSTGNISYLWYVLYIFSVTFHLFAFKGLVYKFEVDFLYEFYKVYMITFPITIVMVALMTKSFLNTKQYPKINAILNFYLVLTFIFFVLNFYIDVLNYSRLSEVSFMAYIFFIVCYSAYKKNRQAYFLLVGWFLLLSSLLFFFLTGKGIISSENVFPYYVEIGVLCEAIIFSFALADRIKTLQREKQFVNEKLLQQRQTEKIRLKQEVDEKTLELKDNLKEKEILYMELNHRVKNNLQMILSIINLQKNESDEVTKEKLEKTYNRIKSFSQLYETLNSKNKAFLISTKEYFESIIRNIIGNHHKDIKINLDIGYDLNTSSLLYIGLILNELVTNCFKYAFDKTGEITIRLYKRGNFCYFEVNDNGKGIDNERKGIGLNIIYVLVNKQLDGNIIIENKNGTLVKIKWKEK